MPALPHALQRSLLTLRELLFTAAPFALPAVGLLWAAYHAHAFDRTLTSPAAARDDPCAGLWMPRNDIR